MLVGERNEAASSNGIPDTSREISRGGGRQISGGVHLAAPDGSLVSHPGSDPVSGFPVSDHGHFVVTGTQQEGITSVVVEAYILELGEGSGVAGTYNGDLFGGGSNGGRHF